MIWFSFFEFFGVGWGKEIGFFYELDSLEARRRTGDFLDTGLVQCSSNPLRSFSLSGFRPIKIQPAVNPYASKLSTGLQLAAFLHCSIKSHIPSLHCA